MEDMVNISIGTAGIVGLLGYLVVFFGLVLLMLVITGFQIFQSMMILME